MEPQRVAHADAARSRARNRMTSVRPESVAEVHV